MCDECLLCVVWCVVLCCVVCAGGCMLEEVLPRYCNHEHTMGVKMMTQIIFQNEFNLQFLVCNTKN